MPTLTEQEEFEQVIESLFLHHPDSNVSAHAANYLSGSIQRDRMTLIKELVMKSLVVVDSSDYEGPDPDERRWQRIAGEFVGFGLRMPTLRAIAQRMPTDSGMGGLNDYDQCDGCGIQLRTRSRHYCRRCTPPPTHVTDSTLPTPF